MVKSIEAVLVALFALAFLPPTAFAERLEVPPLPVSPCADTEVSTNIPFAVDGRHARAWLFRPHWDTVRVTRRGPGAPAGWFVCEDRARYLHMIFR